jgi:protease I
MNKPLSGKIVAVIVENKFIPEEISAYRNCFGLLGASVEFISRIWYDDYKPDHPSWRSPVFYSDIDPLDQQPWQSPEILSIPDDHDISNVSLDRYAAIIMTANYVSVRLRYDTDDSIEDPRQLAQSPPMVRFFAEAMKKPKIVKGALCHGLWILTPSPELLHGRKVTCHTVVMADILNCGAEVVFSASNSGKKMPAKVVVDNDLITGFSRHEVVPFIEAIAEQICILQKC